MNPASRTLILSRSVVIAALGIAFALVLSTALVSSFAARDLARTDTLGASAKQAVSATTQLLSTLAAAEAALVGADSATADERTAITTVRARLREEVLALGPKFSRRTDLRTSLQQLEELSRDPAGPVVQLTAAPDAAPATTAALMARYAEMRRLLYALQRHEFATLVESSAAAAGRARNIQSLNAGLIGLALALAAAGAWFLFRRTGDFAGLITVCAWTRRVQWQGRWISFEEYLARRFNLRCTHGISDEAAERLRNEVANTEIPADLRHNSNPTARASGT